jgi:hypothetical protein
MSRWFLVCHAPAALPRITLFVRRRLVGFSAQKNNRTHKRLTGMRRQGVEKPQAVSVFVASQLKKSRHTMVPRS